MIFVADKKDKGTAITAPTSVPKTAIAIVCNKRYPTPDVSSANKNFKSGWKIPLKILPAIAVPFSDIPDIFITVIEDRKSTRLNSSHHSNSYAVFCLKKK